MDDKKQAVPNSLRAWFLIHFVVDMIFAIPLFLAPVYFLGWLGWATIDPLTARLVAAAFFAIGIESFLVRNSSTEVFKNMLVFKMVWSAFAVIGIVWSMIAGALDLYWFGILLLTLFVFFNILWSYWFNKLKGVAK